jgi:REP element-mobilizing transposase RayT
MNVTLDAFVVMPNHLHGIVLITQNVGATHASPILYHGVASSR